MSLREAETQKEDEMINFELCDDSEGVRVYVCVKLEIISLNLCLLTFNIHFKV